MHVSPNGIAVIRAFEGCLKPVPGRPDAVKAYRCPAGVLTIGWGHTNAHPPRFDADTTWDRATCDAVLDADVERFARRVARILAGVDLAQHEFDALVSFDFNTGGLDRSSIPTKLRAGRRSEVAPTLMRWTKAKGRELPGLVRRRKAEAALFDGRPAEALRIAGAPATVPAPKVVDRPRVGAGDLARAMGPGVGAAATGGLVATAASPEAASRDPAAGLAVLGLGVLLLGVALFFAIRAARRAASNAA